MNESDKNGTSIYPTKDETFPTQEDIPDDESNTVKEEHIRKEDDNESLTSDQEGCEIKSIYSRKWVLRLALRSMGQQQRKLF
mmetsp:Transcript_1057/g.1405  ORF Transcript_1057/g.1405 Transcript_1057/m.1405 type:complete len:82 (+) Transcript_1057:740-985(+)